MAQKTRIIGVPMDLGQSRRGVDMGPSALRVAGLQSRIKQLNYIVEDVGNISVRQAEEQPYGEKRAKYLNEIAGTCKDLAEFVQKTLEEGMLPIVLGGDHSTAVGTVSGVAAHFRKQEKRIGLLWLDAHGDMNTPESSPSGNVHGMPLAAIIGYGAVELVELLGFKPKVEPRNVAVVGARDLDAKERRIVKESGIHVFTMRDIDERGMRDVMAEAIRRHGRRGGEPGPGLCGPRGRAGRRHAGARRRDLPRGTPGDGDDRGQREHGVAGSGGN
jgi:arginase